MTGNFAGPGIKATEAASSHTGMAPCPTPSPLKLGAFARVLAHLSITIWAEEAPRFGFKLGGAVRRKAHRGAKPPGGRGAASPTPGSALGAAGTAGGVVFSPLWGPIKWVRP